MALTIALGADPGYAGLLCKNPMHPYWWTTVWQEAAYDLSGLADSLDMEPYRDKRRRLPDIGLGRNCTIFEVSRRFAYTHRRSCPERALFDAIFVYARQYNESRFQYPLPISEIRATARSVAKWVIRRMDDEGFQAWGDRRRQRSADVRHAKAQERADLIRAYKAAHPEASVRTIAELFTVSKSSVDRYLQSVPFVISDDSR